MRKIILNLAVSLDGFIEGPNGEYDWCIMEPEMHFDKFLARVDGAFFGRKSYELFLTQDPSTFSSDTERNLFAEIAGKEKYIFSNTLAEVNPGSILLKGDIATEVNKIKQQPGKDLWLFGGAQLVSTFIKLNLIDEYQLSVHPIALGAGKPLFENLADRLKLKHIKTENYPSGVVGLFYEPDRS
ncbi:MAG: dihydrofolate reductase [Sphingobacteriales bacterium]|nr:MAG: dihydrofolate reductase [Sphingobacteriales bacterium]